MARSPGPARLPVHRSKVPPFRLIAPPALSVSAAPAAPCSGSPPARAALRPSAAAAVALGNGSSTRGFGTPPPPACAYGCRAAPGAAPSESAGARRCGRGTRSEEHTSELQSPCNLVCRLLLEKKKEIDLSSVLYDIARDRD